jgi:hypothetical protein
LRSIYCTNDGLVRPFGDIDVATAEVLLSSLERIDLSLRTVHVNKIIGDKVVDRTNRVYSTSVPS